MAFKSQAATRVWVAFERDHILTPHLKKLLHGLGGLFFQKSDEHTSPEGVTSELYIFQFGSQQHAEKFIYNIRKRMEQHLVLDPDYSLTMEYEPITIRVPVIIRGSTPA